MTTYSIRFGLKWNSNLFTSADKLITAAKNGLIEMVKTPVNEFKNKHEFFENGIKVAEFIHDHSFGFSTQAYGVKILN
jgi:predicted histidine transporter YuiF (NhaC family)